MNSAEDRFIRQRLLDEVGDAGQVRIGASVYSPPGRLDALARRVALRYASGCGFLLGPNAEGHSVVDEHATQLLQSHFRHAPSASVAMGAASVLDAVLNILRSEPSSGAPHQSS